MAPRSKSEAPAQHQQPSRKGKKAWRKNVDITQVQKGLDEVRDEEIQGGVVAEKPSNELFMVDSTGSAEIRSRVAKIVKPLRADQILAQRSAVPAVSTRIIKHAGVSDGVVERSSKRSRTGVSRAHYERLRKRAYGGEGVPKDVVKSDGRAHHDPWATPENIADSQTSFLSPQKPIKAPSTLKEAPVSLLKGNKPMPAVVKPRAGTSYNPAFDDWDALIEKEGAKAVAAEQQRLEEERFERERAEKVAEAELEAEEDAESAWEGFETANESSGEDHRSTRLPRRKTPAERNKVKRRRVREGEEKHQTAMRSRGQREAQRKREKEIAEQFTSDMAVAKTHAPNEVSSEDEADYDIIQDRVLRKRMLGKSRIPRPDLELTLPDELEDSLRKLKPEGNLLRDRFHNLLVRGRVETRRPHEQRKQGRRMETEKWSYKDFEIPGVAAR